MSGPKRSVVLADHKTSVSFEEPFWNGLKEIAAEKKLSRSALMQRNR
jgi:predicted DNA-binding ribbon-helix-helix protein